MKVSVIIPTFNETGNIVELLQEIIANIPNTFDYELIVVDDNSPDGTYNLVKTSFGNNPKVIPLLRKDERGLGKSIRRGIEAASGDKIIVMDADFTHDPIEIPRLLHISMMYDIVSGSRFCQGGIMQDRFHYIGSWLFNVMMRLVLGTRVQDNLGGYFIIGKKEMMSLPLDSIFYGYGDYFFRLLHFAQKKDMTIVEIPAKYLTRQKGDSKSIYLKMLFKYTKEVVIWKYQMMTAKKPHTGDSFSKEGK